MSDRLSQLLREADVSAPVGSRHGSPIAIAEAVRRRRRREIIRTRVITTACVIFGVAALGFTLRKSEPTPEIAQSKPTAPATPKVSVAQLEIDARVAELTAERLLASESARRAATRSDVRVNLQEQSDRAALVLIYEGDHYARGKRSDDAIAAYQRAIELFPQSRWADVARQRLKDFST